MKQGADVRRFVICFMAAFVVSLVLPGVGEMFPNSILGLAAYLVGVLLVAFAFYAAALVVTRIRARRAKL